MLLYTHVFEDYVIIQDKKYMEHGPYIKITADNYIQLWEIPLYGGIDLHIKTYENIQTAIKEMAELS